MPVTANARSAVGTLGGIGEVMYEIGYIYVEFPGDYVLEVGS